MTKIGDIIGDKWTLQRKIGFGGQGQVYAASGQEGEPEVAIKIIKATKAKKRKRFLNEVAIHASLSENGASNIVPVLDHNLNELSEGVVSGYIVMPLAIMTLTEARPILRNRLELCLEITRGILNGIKQAHEAEVIHRDIKPSNVLFLDESLRNPMLCDFGICLLKETPFENRLTDVGETVGAKFFMAPEQQRGGVTDVDETADLYAVGKLLHFIYTGRYLFREKLDEAFTKEELENDARLLAVRDKILSVTVREKAKERIQSAEKLLVAIDTLEPRVHSEPDIRSSHETADVPLVSRNEPVESDTQYRSLAERLLAEGCSSIILEFDDCMDDFSRIWPEIHSQIETRPEHAPIASRNLIEQQPRSAALCLAISKTDNEECFSPLRRMIEKITKTSEGLSGFPAIFTVPHVQAGFYYMLLSVSALCFESWKVFNRALTDKFEWYYQSGRPLFSYGFDHPYFFHSEAMQMKATDTHDLYRALLLEWVAHQLLNISEKELFNAYIQTQMLMSLRGVQLVERGEDVSVWPDFGRFYGGRAEIILQRIWGDASYAQGVLKAFGETREQFFGNLKNRLDQLIPRLQVSRFRWASIQEWSPK